MNAASTLIHRQRAEITSGIRSRQGFWGATLLLAMLPLVLLYQSLTEVGIATLMHWILAAGAGLLSFAVFDFKKMPNWLNRIGALLAGLSAMIFFLQGLSDLIPNSTLAYIAYDLLGQTIEFWSVALFIVLWCGGLLLVDSHGDTKAFGFLAMAIYLASEVHHMNLAAVGAPPNGFMKILMLAPIVWLLLESSKVQPES